MVGLLAISLSLLSSSFRLLISFAIKKLLLRSLKNTSVSYPFDCCCHFTVSENMPEPLFCVEKDIILPGNLSPLKSRCNLRVMCLKHYVMQWNHIIKCLTYFYFVVSDRVSAFDCFTSDTECWREDESSRSSEIFHVSLLLSLIDSVLVPLGHYLPPRAPLPPVVAITRGGERRDSLCKNAWMEGSVASHPAEFPDLWPGDLCGSWDHIRATTAAGGWRAGKLYDHGLRWAFSKSWNSYITM